MTRAARYLCLYMPTTHPLLLPALFSLCLAFPARAQHAPALIAQGDSLLALKDAVQAMEKYNAAVVLAPSADAFAARARASFALGKYDKSLQDVQTALGMDSLHVPANSQRALHALRMNDHHGAIRYANRALGSGDQGMEHKQALVARGEARAALGLNSQAIEDLTAALVNSGREDAEALKTLARLHDAGNNPAASLAVLELLCQLEPADIGNWSNKGFELNRLERYEEALQALDTALKLDKDEPVVLSNKAYALLKLGRDQEAFAAVNHCLKADKLNPYALRTRAQLYLRKGERDKACNDLSLAKAMGGAPEVDELVKQYCAGRSSGQ